MNITILQFTTLASLAVYVKTERPEGYLINTLHNTLSAKLSSFQLSIAMKKYGAMVKQKRRHSTFKSLQRDYLPVYLCRCCIQPIAIQTCKAKVTFVQSKLTVVILNSMKA